MSASQSAVSQRWRIISHSTLHWKIWDDRCVVFNSASGQTHLLDPVPGLLLRLVDEGCGDMEELLKRVASLLDVDLTNDARSVLQETLLELNNLGLIEPIAS